MSLFCLCTSMAVFFNYILTITLLAPIIFLLAPSNILINNNNNQFIQAQKITNNKNNILTNLNNKNIDQQYCINNVNKSLLYNQNTNEKCKKDLTSNVTMNDNDDYSTIEKYGYYNYSIESYTISRSFKLYSDFINSTLGRIIAFTTMIVLLIISSVGIMQIKSTFEPSKAFPSDSQLADSLSEIK